MTAPVLPLEGLLRLRADWRRAGAVVVFTSGCFDLLHRGHVDFLRRARAEGDVLVVGLDNDASAAALKGPGRPLVSQDDRAAVIAGLEGVDAVTVLDEPTAAALIATLAPDVLVTGGDASAEHTIGGAEVVRRGGRLRSLPFLPGHSTGALVERVLASHLGSRPDGAVTAGPGLAGLAESIHVKQRVLAECAGAILVAARLLSETVLGGGKVLLFGNGGSAAEAQHIAAELVGRFRGERRALPALALSTDGSALTALGNDYGFEHVFARQIEAHARPGDAVVALSTSGRSPNVLAGVAAARGRRCVVLGITGAGGTQLAGLCDAAVVVPSTVSARIQEASLTIGHVWCELVDAALSDARAP